LKNVNFEIKKGDRVGFIGPTGSGKTTLVDILTGLLLPTEGKFLVDGVNINRENRHLWQLHISHVPQNVFLSDSSVEENIAFGMPKDEINHKRIKESVKEAQLSKVIDGWRKRYQTNIGENGLRISGGQRQRIGIARALYKGAKVLTFDEATNALDNKTEKNIIKSIEGLGKDTTVLMIAHRLTTLKNCNKVFELSTSKNLRETQYNILIK
jgi:ATP-binding cassette subfamily B protein